MSPQSVRPRGLYARQGTCVRQVTWGVRSRSALLAAMLLVAIAAATLIAAGPAAARPVHALAALGRTKGNAAISATRSATSPALGVPAGSL